MYAERKDREGDHSEVACPKLITDYHLWMGGVDVHDQLAFKFEKYYKSLFLGLLNLALVNAYIAFCRATASQGREVRSREDFLVGLGELLLAVGDSDFADHASPARLHPLDSSDDGHHPTECLDVQVTKGRPRFGSARCKVCSTIAKQQGGKRGKNDK